MIDHTFVNTAEESRINNKARSKVAIIGAGAAGLTAAYLLQRKHHVTIFEKESRLGGHAHTILVEQGVDVGTPLDVGFMVLNNRNYPTLHKLLSQLNVCEIPDSEMSFSYYSETSNIQYAINWSHTNQFSKRTNLQSSPLEPQPYNATLLNLLKEILIFCNQARKDLLEDNFWELTLGNYLQSKKYSPALIDSYVIPMGAAIWSSTPQKIFDFPAKTFLYFFDNHGMLSLREGPKWQYIKGGSQTYVKEICKNFTGKVEVNSPIESISRLDDSVIIRPKNNKEQKFDYVIIAAHADEALSLLADPSVDERRFLGAWKYQVNDGILHTDESAMPPDKTAWASWNYINEAGVDDISSFSITYHLNRLQGHENTQKQYFLSLNRHKPIAEEFILRKMKFTHPTYNFESFSTQKELAALNGAKRTYFCGSYFGFGFHEDAVKSGVEVARAFGVEL
ncbi:NAD(P)/FAD-dependent oxidoreductase [Nostoc sp. C117]|uniref:NAD(P)/FAD-dependent oxidoreductase n=1 Tax=Nostoc sp. C117 TaxID=3349875 RepID=UPI00370D0F2F